MSSFIGHSIIGLSASRLAEKKPVSWKWSAWLVLLAISPDINYIAIWTLGHQWIFENSHSIGFSAILPTLTAIFLKLKNNKRVFHKTMMAFAASFSHIIMDLLVGVFPKPYLWPFDSEKIRLPFGILPSAGRLDLHNYYLYKNLLIEMGILLPAIGILYLYKKYYQTKYALVKQLLLILIWIPFLIWGISLNR